MLKPVALALLLSLFPFHLAKANTFIQYGTGVYHRKVAQELNLFYPFFDRQTISFLHARLHQVGKNQLEGNCHLGRRWAYRQQILGFFGSYDLKNLPHRHLCSQITVGTESWYGLTFLGLNGYFPCKKIIDTKTYQLKVLPGLDLTWGHSWTPQTTINFTLYQFFPGMTGGRCSLNWTTTLRQRYQALFSSNLQYDRRRGAIFSLQVQLRLYLTPPKPLSPFYQLVTRDPEIVTTMIPKPTTPPSPYKFVQKEEFSYLCAKDGEWDMELIELMEQFPIRRCSHGIIENGKFITTDPTLEQCTQISKTELHLLKHLANRYLPATPTETQVFLQRQLALIQNVETLDDNTPLAYWKAFVHLKTLIINLGELENFWYQPAGTFQSIQAIVGDSYADFNQLQKTYLLDPVYQEWTEALHTQPVRNTMLNRREEVQAETIANQLLQAELQKYQLSPENLYRTTSDHSFIKIHPFERRYLEGQRCYSTHWLTEIQIATNPAKPDKYMPQAVKILHELQHLKQINPGWGKFPQQAPHAPYKTALLELAPCLQDIITLDRIHKQIHHLPPDIEIDYPQKITLQKQAINPGKVANYLQKHQPQYPNLEALLQQPETHTFFKTLRSP